MHGHDHQCGPIMFVYEQQAWCRSDFIVNAKTEVAQESSLDYAITNMNVCLIKALLGDP